MAWKTNQEFARTDKDCMKPINMVDFAQRVCMRPGPVDAADHAATKPLTPYESVAWTTAFGIVKERMSAAYDNYLTADMGNAAQREYRKGRFDALRDCLDELEERGKP